jgi:hypothetical protein
MRSHAGLGADAGLGVDMDIFQVEAGRIVARKRPGVHDISKAVAPFFLRR